MKKLFVRDTRAAVGTLTATIEGKIHKVLVGQDICRQALQSVGSRRTLLIFDEGLPEELVQQVRNLAGSVMVGCLAVAGETEKTLSGVAKITSACQHFKLDRNDLLIACGGGATCDLVGFCAAIYRRGIDCIYLPTTLLAQVDAAIGGKVAINHDGVKNSLGAFSLPELVACDSSFLAELPMEQCRAGFAEIIKHGAISDRRLFEEIEIPPTSKLVDPGLIEKSIAIKLRIVEQDYREHGPRRLLNFGHTIGHALEAASREQGYPLNHGQAVALGMIAEAEISTKVLGFSPEDVVKLEQRIAAVGLPIRLNQKIALARVRELLSLDKKTFQGRIRWTLLKRLGEGVIDCRVEPAIADAGLAKIGLTC